MKRKAVRVKLPARAMAPYTDEAGSLEDWTSYETRYVKLKPVPLFWPFLWSALLTLLLVVSFGVVGSDLTRPQEDPATSSRAMATP